ncbi:branched-chain amino acid aminotransferase [Chondrinema litorale]|uniref:branched-chain amino acid aminotransferase n=1 Tax=Chondrinema litorale TaxID=2994555 RepID=UPI0025442A3C|nr:branched-chain amino acid aminotransferase [Chondrinema litorale]UZR95339.1 branched-chain amino acid aminotransferase [Chondrinema litorale]
MIDTGLDITTEKVAQSGLPKVDFNNIPFGKIYSDHMFVADYDGKQWGDFRIVPFNKLNLSPATSVLHYGQSIFEGLKGFKSQSDDSVLVFRPQANAKRMRESALRMCMPDLPEELFMTGLHRLIDLDRNWVPDVEDASLYIRPFMFSTDEYIGLKPSEKYQFIIFTCPVGKYYAAPVKVKVETKYTRASKGGTGYAKTAGNYAAAMYPAKLAQQQGFDQLLWTDGVEHKLIEESGTMNVLFVFNDKLVSIPTSDTILPGITRESVLKIARDWGLTVEERPVEVAEIISGVKDGSLKEMFGAGTAAVITHISHVGLDGDTYELPAVETREISNKILTELKGIQRGEIVDNRGWNYKI